MFPSSLKLPESGIAGVEERPLDLGSYRTRVSPVVLSMQDTRLRQVSLPP